GDWNYVNLSVILDVFVSLAPLYSEASYDRFDGLNIFCWGCHDGSDSPLLYVDALNFPAILARLSFYEWVPPVVGADEYHLV
ncbi:hypothetical protein JDS67_28530, partial [Bacillus cereus]|uniref:hypothetical protein n=1 Tax=Bacillus cereus TaxID=1396 RepID=UPI0018F663B2